MQAVYENHYLTDTDVANYARQSFAKLAENFTADQNANLIKFLARGMASGDWQELIESMGCHSTLEDAHEMAVYLRSIPGHWVPFSHPQVALRMRAPVPITVQCYKHKVGFVESGESRRYIKSAPILFIPNEFRAAAENVKQGSGGVHPESELWRSTYIRKCMEMIDTYLVAVNSGVCPEQARFFLPQGVELNWVWTGSLYAFANAYNQRSDSHAQREIQDLFEDISEIIEPLYPISWAALTQGAY